MLQEEKSSITMTTSATATLPLAPRIIASAKLADVNHHRANMKMIDSSLLKQLFVNEFASSAGGGDFATSGAGAAASVVATGAARVAPQDCPSSLSSSSTRGGGGSGNKKPAVLSKAILPRGGIRTAYHDKLLIARNMAPTPSPPRPTPRPTPSPSAAAIGGAPPPTKKQRRIEEPPCSPRNEAIVPTTVVSSSLPAPTYAFQQAREQLVTAKAAGVATTRETAVPQQAVSSAPPSRSGLLPSRPVSPGSIASLENQSAMMADAASTADDSSTACSSSQQQAEELDFLNSMSKEDRTLFLRRKRNREAAKQSREKKKHTFNALIMARQKLRQENERLARIVRGHGVVNARSSPPPSNNKKEETFDDKETPASAPLDTANNGTCSDQSLVARLLLAGGDQSFVLSDPTKRDHPIVFASPGFYRMTGYTSKQVIGRSAQSLFLHGPRTDPEAMREIRRALNDEQQRRHEGFSSSPAVTDVKEAVHCHKADGTPFWRQVSIWPLRDSNNNRIINHVTLYREVDDQHNMAS